MSKLPSLNARKVIQALRRAGFVEDRQKGSHLILIHPETKARTVVPMHAGRTIKESLLRAIVRDANLTDDAAIFETVQIGGDRQGVDIPCSAPTGIEKAAGLGNAPSPVLRAWWALRDSVCVAAGAG